MNDEHREWLKVVNEARMARNLSVRSAAKLAAVPPATMQGWLNGRHYPTPQLRAAFQAFVERLGIPAS